MTARTCTGRALWQALGTSTELVLTDANALARARAIVELELDRVDRACSRFREDSELTRVNMRAGRTLQLDDPLLVEAIDLALRAAELTDGDVDPTVGAALEAAGYDRDWQLLMAPDDCEQGRGPRVIAKRCAGWETVEFDRERATLRVPRGVKLDLGATAKAWAADHACGAVHNETGCGVLVSLGGDIATAGPAPAAGWPVHVTDDHRDGIDAAGQTISISSGGLATSSTTVRRWRHRGATMHHILDPSTGAPVEGVWRTVSVAAANCADANIAATAAIVRGSSAPRWLAELRLPARQARRRGCDCRVMARGRGRGGHGQRASARDAKCGAMSSIIAAAGPSAYWYLTRSSGTVALILLTGALVLGVIDVRRWSTETWPRFVVDSLHRNVSLLALAFLGLHILTAVLDSFAPITLVNSVIPFTGSYRPLWLGLGALSFDLMLAVIVTSLLRRRMGHAIWRATHWLSYASWPIALLHGFGTGSDVKSTWMMAISITCLLAVIAAVLVRIAAGWPDRLAVRGAALSGTAIFTLGLLLWLPSGPLGKEWARRSGTPSKLLPHTTSISSASSTEASR
jgi:thiamine biosynthesis lipoprotein ApbE